MTVPMIIGECLWQTHFAGRVFAGMKEAKGFLPHGRHFVRHGLRHFFPGVSAICNCGLRICFCCENRKIACHLQLLTRERWDRFCPGTLTGPRSWKNAGIPRHLVGQGAKIPLGSFCRQVKLSTHTWNYLPILMIFLFLRDFLRLIFGIASFQCREGRSGRLLTAF